MDFPTIRHETSVAMPHWRFRSCQDDEFRPIDVVVIASSAATVLPRKRIAIVVTAPLVPMPFPRGIFLRGGIGRDTDVGKAA